MATCNTCGEYYRLTPYNNSCVCDECVDSLAEQSALFDPDDDYRIEIDMLKNPSGKTPPVFYDDRDTESFSS
jgi:hypothetical protein